MQTIEQQNLLQHIFLQRLPQKISVYSNYIYGAMQGNIDSSTALKLSNSFEELLDTINKMELSSIHGIMKHLSPELQEFLNNPKIATSSQLSSILNNLQILEDIIHSQILAYQALLSVDETTGLPNKIRLFELIDIELSRTRRQSLDLCLSIIHMHNIETLVKENSITFEQIICDLANLIKTRLRKSDIVTKPAEYFFCILLPDTELSTAMPLLKEIQSLLDNYSNKLSLNTALKVNITLVEASALSEPISLYSKARNNIESAIEKNTIIATIDKSIMGN